MPVPIGGSPATQGIAFGVLCRKIEAVQIDFYFRLIVENGPGVPRSKTVIEITFLAMIFSRMPLFVLDSEAPPID
jgi:hypothetical protein